jgi:UDP-glucose 4-epimerase
MTAIAGRGSYRLVPFPPDRKRIDIGSYHSDTRKVRAALGWAPTVPLAEGLARTIAYYTEHKDRYL